MSSFGQAKNSWDFWLAKKNLRFVYAQAIFFSQ